VIGAVGCRIDLNYASRLCVIFAVKEQQLHPRGITGINAEVDAAINDLGA
jgi:hypothetical protein